jgi:uncharacterized protein (DUF924 family)
MTVYQQIIKFWFQDTTPEKWWTSDPIFDKQIESRFLDLLHQAIRCELHDWRNEPQGRLAEIIVLDQFSRNVFRGTPQAFAQDSMALALAQETIRLGLHTQLSSTERSFLLLPYMHSESVTIHVTAEQLYREFAPKENHEFELKHKAIVDRYPHRNAILGRASTPEEIEFLKQPGSAF